MTFDKEVLKKIKEEEKRWEETTVKKFLEKAPERKEKFMTDDGFEIKRIYTPADLGEDWNYMEKLDSQENIPSRGEFTQRCTGQNMDYETVRRLRYSRGVKQEVQVLTKPGADWAKRSL